MDINNQSSPWWTPVVLTVLMPMSACYEGVTAAETAGDLPGATSAGDDDTGQPSGGPSGGGEDDPSGGEDDASGEGSDGSPDDSSGDADGGTTSRFAPPPGTLRRLTVAEYRNSVRDLLGVEPPEAADLRGDDSIAGFTSIGARRVALSAQAIELFEEVSYEIAEAVFADVEGRDRLLGCDPEQANDACVQGFLSAFARRFYRRPATAEERLRLTAVVEQVAAASDIWTGLSYGLAAMLQSPNFLYRVELGTPQEDSPWRAYDGFELASRLSFLITGSTPDDALLAAAESGALKTEEGLREQIDRLMESPRVQGVILGFFSEQLRLHEVLKMNKSPEEYPEFRPELVEAMLAELEYVVRDWVWTQRRPVSELLVSPKTFVNGILADFYGLPTPQDEGFVPWERSEDDPRVGLLGAAGLLALNASYAETSATKRGRYIVEHLLCTAIQEPPPGIDTSLPPVPTGIRQTMRERVVAHMEIATCGACHQFMDPVGLPLEHFDAIGQYRETDHGLTIDASGEIAGVSFDGLRGLATTLAADPRVDSCMVRRFYEFALAHTSGASDREAIEQLDAHYRSSGGDYTELLRALVEHDAFQLATETP